MLKKAFNRREFMKVGTVGVLGSTLTLNALGDVDTESLKGSLPKTVLDQFEKNELTQIMVETVHCDQPNNIPVVRLKDAQERPLHIYVGVAEGNAIRMALDAQATPRPMTHDLMSQLVQTAGMPIECAVITKLEQTTFYGALIVHVGGALQAVDCRPSDAIALCLRTGSPIYANPSLL